MATKPLRSSWAIPFFCSLLLLTLFCLAQPGNQRVRAGSVTPATQPPSSQSRGPAVASLADSNPRTLKPSPLASNKLLRAQTFFERNQGQVDSEVLFLSRGSGYSLFLTRSGATFVLPAPRDKNSSGATRKSRYFRLCFGDANPQADLTGLEKQPGSSNYFSGSDPKLWHTRIPQFAKVRYSNLYPGIDLIFYFRDGHLEYDLVAAPGADLAAVSLQVQGASPSLTRQGDVAIKMGANELLRLRKPFAYQGTASSPVVAADYSLRHNKLSFVTGHYDRTQPLTIDPALIFATFITSNCAACQDQVNDIAADNTGVYITGSTNAAIFPATATGPASSSNQNDDQTFVVKLDPTGSHVLYSVFLSDSTGVSIAVDSAGSAYVGGVADYPGVPGFAPFPLTAGVFSATVPSNAAGPAACATKLSPDGSAILYSTLLQQPMPSGTPVATFQNVNPAKIAVDSAGALYMTGTTSPNMFNRFTSIWMPLPVTLGAFQTSPGSDFVLKLNPTASGLDYATYIDGTNDTDPFVAGVAVDSAGHAFVAGSTLGNTFPTTPGAYQTSNQSPSGFTTAFVMELNPTGTAPVYSTLFGSSGQALGLALDSQGQAVIAGSSSGTLPINPPAMCGTSPANTTGTYVAKFKADGSGLVYVSSLCGSESAAATVAVDSAGAAYVIGITGSPADFQPSLLQPIQGYPPSNSNANIALKFDTSGNLQWSTFFGVNSSGIIEVGVQSPRIVVDGTGAAYILDTSDILPTPNSIGPPALAQGVGGSTESLNFLLKIAPSLGAPVPLVSPRQLSFTNQNVGTSSAAVDVQVGNFGDAPASPIATITGDFLETDNCSVPVPGGQKCDVQVVFKPSVTGPRTGTLTVSFGGTIPAQTVALSGNAGAAAVTLSPASLSFPTQATGTTSGELQVTITNSGTGPLIISSLQVTGPFATTNTCGAPVAPANDCTVQVTFTPTASGTQTGTLTIADNAANSPQTVALTGNVQTTPPAGQPPSIGLGVASSGSTSATVTAGASASYALSIGGAGMSGTASLTCTGAPKGASCSVPASVPLNAATASSFNVSVTTTSRSELLFFPIGPTPWLWALAILGCLILCKAAFAQPRLRLRWRFAPLLALALCACGGGGSSSPTPTPNPNGTPAGTSTITVTATSGTTTQVQKLTLTVN